MPLNDLLLPRPLGRLLEIKVFQSRLVPVFASRGEGIQHIRIRGWVSRTKFLGNLKISGQLHCNEKYRLILWHFMLRNLSMNMVDHEKFDLMPRNIMNTFSVSFGPKNITFGNSRNIALTPRTFSCWVLHNRLWHKLELHFKARNSMNF